MNFLNIHIPSTTLSPEFIGCEPVDRATWICLISYCAFHETKGRVEGCRDWGDRRWQQTMHITAAEVMRPCPLWSWEGDDLIVFGYNKECEVLIERRRLGGQMTAAKRWGNSPASSLAITPSNSPAINSASSNERKGNETKGNETKLPPGLPPKVDVESSIDAPRGWPKTEAEAVAVAEMSGVPKEFAIPTYNRAVGRGYRDSKGNVVFNFRAFLKAAWSTDQSVKAEQKTNGTNGRTQLWRGKDVRSLTGQDLVEYAKG